jgi:hypothetical protein
MSDDEFARLMELAKKANVKAEHREAQRQSFAYGNTHFENDAITRETVAQAAQMLADEPKN